MKPIERGEILGLAEYETVRDQFRSRIIGEKKRRRVRLGPNASTLFENRDTVLLQIQEMLRTERITRPSAIDHEIETYNALLPGADELSCTVMIEIADASEREAFLRAAVGFEKHVALVAGSERVQARGIDREGATADRTTAVHYLKLRLPKRLADEIRSQGPGRPIAVNLALEVDHPAYGARAALPPETVLELTEDLRA
ncbi:MAG TPA: DUF3501 family protein [Polyangiaceae bacterium]|jgi:hypothetical protein|nr:DUF3501 family protein [Polyangiaceae bacterium]